MGFGSCMSGKPDAGHIRRPTTGTQVPEIGLVGNFRKGECSVDEG